MYDLKLVKRLYKNMLLVRRAEEYIAGVYFTDVIKSPIHLSIGQEAVAIGACDPLNKDDLVSNSCRGHATYIAKGGNLNAMMAELYGKKNGCAGGKAGSMHLADVENGVLGSSAIVGTTIPVTAGYALALKMEAKKTGKQRLAIAMFGDGATEEGAFYETINFAAIKQLPIIFVCENNGLAIHSPLKKRWATVDVCARAASFGIKTHRVDDGDIFKLHKIISEEVNNIRNHKSGPVFIECITYRWLEHVGPTDDHHESYRDKNELKFWQEHDQLKRLASMLDESECLIIEKEVEQEIKKAAEFAKKGEFPGEAELHVRSYVVEKKHNLLKAKTDNSRLIRYVDALHEALDQEMSRDEKVFLFGLDVDDHKGIQGSTLGLSEKFGVDRVFSTPLSEDSMTGIAIGAAMAGLRPVHVHIRMDFMLLCMNQLINMAAKAHYMYDGQVKVPLVVRTMIGRSWGQGAQHSQALHALFMHIPGLKVVAPSNAYDAKGCLIASIRDDNPVIFVEHRLLYGIESYVPEDEYVSPIGKARVIKSGSDITIVAISHMVIEALRAQKHLEKLEIAAEIIDPVWLRPLDINTIVKSVKKTGRLLVVDNAWLNCGASSEIITQVIEALPDGINGKPIAIIRMGFADVTCPTVRSLENLFYPNGCTIVAKAYSLVTGKSCKDFVCDNDTEIDAFKGPF
jgi:pyruvate/2-oxoglutarate/acetoin dehydrogenase E1 component/TPP-dependent pyruvate/acetoin dehydrogenase alpha subunit